MTMPPKGVAVSDLLNNVHRHMDESLKVWEHQSTCTLTEAASIVQKANRHLTCSYADSMVKCSRQGMNLFYGNSVRNAKPLLDWRGTDNYQVRLCP